MISQLIVRGANPPDGKFTFKLAEPATTSAGVFKTDGTLVKTLWNAVKLPAGSFTRVWDGTDDLGAKVASPEAAYEIKILTNNVQYAWQGTIGNTSTAMSGPTKRTGVYNCMNGLAFTDTAGYFCSGYCEGIPSIGKFLIAKPQEEIRLFTDRASCMDTNYVATDGVRVYWGAFDSGSDIDDSFVYATQVSDDKEVTFPAGQAFKPKYSRVFQAISLVKQANSYISGLAVQKKGNYLFVARSRLNQLQVLDKTTGALVQTLTFPNPRALSVDGDHLWMATDTNTMAKYPVNRDGTLGPTTLKLAGLLDPLASQVSPDGMTVSVADGGSSQQVKFFNNRTGAATSTLGVAGGYAKEAAVKDDKFYLTDSMNVQFPSTATLVNFIAYQPDGSFWVNDPGNYRVQHFSKDRAFIDRLMSLGCTYSVWVDKNNPKRLFSDLLEFEVDYSVPNLVGSAGWKLTQNRSATATGGRGAELAGINYKKFPNYITTLSNGRTYGLLRTVVGKVNTSEVVELTASSQLRFTGIVLKDLGTILCADGSLQEHTQNGTTATFKRYPLTGFNESGNPTWSETPEVLAKATTDSTIGNPVVRPNGQIFSTTDKVVLFNYKAWANQAQDPHSGYHLGVMKKGADDAYVFQTEKSTHPNYRGPYPGAGYFDTGNNVNDYAGGNVNILDRQIITSYHGEFWRNSQTNKYNHYYDNGLAIGQFGVTRPEVGMRSIAAPMMAGNALTPALIKDEKGDLYLWHGDESDHAGIHRWKITGLDTIAEQTIPMPFPSAYQAPPRNYVDLMEGLPFDQTLADQTAGWTRTPAADILKDPYTSYFRVWTSTQQMDRSAENDLLINYVQKTADAVSVSRDLGENQVKTNWAITGLISYPRNVPNGAAISQSFEVLDAAGKVLTAISPSAEIGSKQTVLNCNTAKLNLADPSKLGEPAPFILSVADGKVTFTYGDSAPVTAPLADATGDWRKPHSIRLRFENNGKKLPAHGAAINLGGLKFYQDVPIPAATSTGLSSVP